MTSEKPEALSGTRNEPTRDAEPTLPAERAYTAVVANSRAVVGDSTVVIGDSTVVVGDSAAVVGSSTALVGRSTATAADRAALDHPRAAFLVRERRHGPEGVTLPPRHEPGTAGPTSGQWGSG